MSATAWLASFAERAREAWQGAWLPFSASPHETSRSKPRDAPRSGAAVPLFAWPLLSASVVAVSSAAAVFQKMKEVPPITLAAWRLQLTSVLLGIGAVQQWRSMPYEDRRNTKQHVWWLAGSGACLAVHFGAWVWSLQRTSLTHSLLLVSTTPVIMAAGALALRHPISKGEVGGAVLALVGSIILSLGAISERDASVAGDLAALCAALAMIGYLLVGRKLRQWMPIFVYAFPVTACAALLLSLAALAVGSGGGIGGGGDSGGGGDGGDEFDSGGGDFGGSGGGAASGNTGHGRIVGDDRHGVVGWVASGRYAPLVLYLAVGPGIVGHTGFNTVLRYLSPLAVGLATTLEPLVGPLIGWLLGVMQPPGLFTYAGGALVFASTVVVTVASGRRARAEAEAEKQGAGGDVALAEVFKEFQDAEMERESLLGSDWS